MDKDIVKHLRSLVKNEGKCDRVDEVDFPCKDCPVPHEINGCGSFNIAFKAAKEILNKLKIQRVIEKELSR